MFATVCDCGIATCVSTPCWNRRVSATIPFVTSADPTFSLRLLAPQSDGVSDTYCVAELSHVQQDYKLSPWSGPLAPHFSKTVQSRCWTWRCVACVCVLSKPGSKALTPTPPPQRQRTQRSFTHSVVAHHVAEKG